MTALTLVTRHSPRNTGATAMDYVATVVLMAGALVWLLDVMIIFPGLDDVTATYVHPIRALAR